MSIDIDSVHATDEIDRELAIRVHGDLMSVAVASGRIAAARAHLELMESLIKGRSTGMVEAIERSKGLLSQ